MAEIKLNYKDEEFNDLEIIVDITFISQRMVGIYTDLMTTIGRLYALGQVIKNDMPTRGSIIVKNKDDPKEAKKQLAQHNAEMKEIRDEFDGIKQTELFQGKIDLIKLILRANHYNGTLLLDNDFWDSSVDPSEFNEFLSACISKTKKKE